MLDTCTETVAGIMVGAYVWWLLICLPCGTSSFVSMSALGVKSLQSVLMSK